MNIRFLDPAQREVDDAVAWYDEQDPDENLGLDFLDSLDRSLQLIRTFPEAATESNRASGDACSRASPTK
jgi:hypothetical protein